MSNEKPHADPAENAVGDKPTDWGTNVGRQSLDDDVAALAAASGTPQALLTPAADQKIDDDDDLIVSDAQTLRMLMVERAAKVLVDLAERPGFGRRAAVDLEDVLELADYYIGDEDYPMKNVVVDEGKRFFDQMTQQADFRPKIAPWLDGVLSPSSESFIADRAAAQAEQARLYREGTGGLFHSMMKPGARHPRSTTGKEPTFAERMDSLFGKPVQANIRVEELQVDDLVTSHGDVVIGQPTWDGRAERWVVDVYCPKKDETYTHRAKVDDRVDIFNER